MSKETPQEKRDRMAAEGRDAMKEHAARVAFVEKNTVRLRELRLAKEAADAAALAATPPAPQKTKAKAKAKKGKQAAG